MPSKHLSVAVALALAGVLLLPSLAVARDPRDWGHREPERYRGPPTFSARDYGDRGDFRNDGRFQDERPFRDGWRDRDDRRFGRWDHDERRHRSDFDINRPWSAPRGSGWDSPRSQIYPGQNRMMIEDDRWD